MNTLRANSAYRMAGIFACLVVCMCLAATSGCQRIAEPSDAVPGGSVHKVDVALDVGGPVLTLTSDYFDPIVSTELPGRPKIFDIPAEAPILFCWTAEPSEGGDPIDAYRYGWDVLDLNDDEQWVGWIPFDGSEVCLPNPSQFFFGTHAFHVEVRDTGGKRSRISLTVNIVYGPQRLDILPKSCANRFKPRGKGLLTVALPLTRGQDAGDIDVSRVKMWIGAQTIKPVMARIRDVASPAFELCGCNTGGRDGVDDLVLKFPVEEITRALGAVSRGDQRMIAVSGEYNSLGFDVVDCIVIAGGPKPEDDALALRDGVLRELENAYNNRNFDRARMLFDDDFVFFFSPVDIGAGDVSVSQWDKTSELAATASLFSVDGRKGNRLTDRTGNSPSRVAASEESTWGRTKWELSTNPPSGFTWVELSLLYPPGEDNWVTVIPDPARYPGEVWYEKTVEYFLFVQTSTSTFLNAAPIRASFVVRPVEIRGENIWQLVRWRDDI